MTYTIVLTKEQKQLVVQALTKLSEFHLGQTAAAKEDSKKLAAAVEKSITHGTNDLTK